MPNDPREGCPIAFQPRDLSEKIRFVFVAAPLSSGEDVFANVCAAVKTADALMDAGFIPFVPHLNVVWAMISPKGRTTWLLWDNEWLKKCDAVLRVPGESAGADAEVDLAIKLGIPVFFSVEHILTVAPGPQPEPTPDQTWREEQAAVSTTDLQPPERYRHLLDEPMEDLG